MGIGFTLNKTAKKARSYQKLKKLWLQHMEDGWYVSKMRKIEYLGYWSFKAVKYYR